MKSSNDSTKRKIPWGTILLGFILGVVAIAFIANFGDDEPEEPVAAEAAAAPPAASIDVTAKKIYSDYNANEVAADNIYKDNFVIITGKVLKISKDPFDDVYVVLSGGKEYSMTGTWCYVKDNSTISLLQIGETVTFTGKVQGLVAGNVIIKNCEVQ